MGVSGKTDDYKFHPDMPIVRTDAQAEGAIVGSFRDYIVHGTCDVDFVHSRYDKTAKSICPPRNVSELTGEVVRSVGSANLASSEEYDPPISSS